MPNREWRGGLRAKSNLNGGDYPRAETCYVPATNAANIYKGQLVKRTGSGSPDAKYTAVQVMAPGDGGVPYGVVAGRRYEGAAPRDRKFLPALTEGYLHVITLEDAVYEASVTNGVMTADDVGLNIDMTTPLETPGDLAYGLPGLHVDAGTKGLTATLPLRVMGLKDVEDNDATLDNAIWLFSLNVQSHHSATGE